MKKTLVMLMVLGLAFPAWGQLSDEAALDDYNRSSSFGIKPAVSPFSLIDLSRVRWSNSYSVSFFSGGNYSGSVGLFRTTMFYDLSSKLSLSLNLGVVHNTGAIWGDGSSNASLLPGFILDYHPSNSFRMSIGVQTYSGYVPYYYYYRPAYWDYPVAP
ncbi:MAG: hypothetical protein JSV52_00025 [Candidatus Zixiibacteriota bacterium]|nr:MAG: hypothetical protein JSV52_00025 [candidate division Zixibacteria bacterium]